MPVSAMQPATVKCPKCGEPVPLTEALAAPLLAAKEAEFAAQLRAEERKTAAAREAAEAAQQRLAADQAKLTRERNDLAQQREDDGRRIDAEVARRTREQVDQQLSVQLGEEKKRITAMEEQRATQRVSDQLADKDRTLRELMERMAAVTARLDASQRNESELRRKELAAEDRLRDMELAKGREIAAGAELARQRAIESEAQRHQLAMSDKDRIIREMSAKLEDAARKAQLGSQQAQGETLEVLLEAQLRSKFPFDVVEPIAKGVSGADVLQIVRDEGGRECGRILWESKRTQHWSAGWLPKLKTDQRNAKADLAVLISQAMPPEVQHFNEVDGVWVSSLSCTVPVATALRASLLQLGQHRRANEGAQSKAELMYEYLNGPQFRGMMQALAAQWDDMQKELADEKKSTQKRWAKREKQIDLLLTSTSGIYGHIQAIAGRDFKTIEAFEEAETLQLEPGN